MRETLPHTALMVTTLLFATMLSSCSALRHVRAREQVDSVARERVVVYVHDTIEVQARQTVTQTVVEYYPAYDTVYLNAPAVRPDQKADNLVEGMPHCGTADQSHGTASQETLPHLPAVPQPIRSVTRTEIRTEAGLTASRDSVTLSDTSSEVSREYESESGEPPRPTALQYLRLAIILVLSIALCILLIRIRLSQYL